MTPNPPDAPEDAPPRPAANTLRAYAQDWAEFARWCRGRGADPLPPAPELIGLYLADLAAPSAAGKARALSVASIARRLSGLVWGYARRGFTLDRKDHRIATVLAGIRRDHARPPVQKTAIRPEDIAAMVATLPHDLRGLRDRAILLIGFAAALRRSEIVSLDCGRGDGPGPGGRIEIREGGVLVTLRGKTGLRVIEIARDAHDRICPVRALEQWLHFAKIDRGPIFVAVSRDGRRALPDRLGDKHVARLVKQTVEAAGLRPDLPAAERTRLYSGESLRGALPRGPG